MDHEEILTLVRRFAARVRLVLPVRSVILFGSAARGFQRSDSDIDVAVMVAPSDEDFLDREASLFRIRREIDDRIEPLLFESETDRGGFLAEIMRDGIVVN